MLEDKLNDKILHRPSPEELVLGGVLHEDPRTADQKYEEAIEEEYAKREGGAWLCDEFVMTPATAVDSYDNGCMWSYRLNRIEAAFKLTFTVKCLVLVVKLELQIHLFIQRLSLVYQSC